MTSGSNFHIIQGYGMAMNFISKVSHSRMLAENTLDKNRNTGPISVTTGDLFPRTGYYRYAGHADCNKRDCFVPEQTSHMIFEKDERVPLLGSCPHKVRWSFVGEYESF